MEEQARLIVEILWFDCEKNKFAGVSEVLIAFHASDAVGFAHEMSEAVACSVTGV